MKAYTIFDDFPEDVKLELFYYGIDLTTHPEGRPRPDDMEMKNILENYECVIIGTSQKIKNYMFDNIHSRRIIATASKGTDHIHIPEDKQELIKVINTPKAVVKSVTEFTIGCALSCCKRLIEGSKLYLHGRDNKALNRKPEDLSGRIIGVAGAGNISLSIMQYAALFGMKILCWTPHPEKHLYLSEQGIKFVDLETLAANSDVISVNLPNIDNLHGIISQELISLMKDNAIFISVSRLELVNVNALFQKAFVNPNFYVCIDVDINASVVNAIREQPNILITPHIAAGTIETRQRMFHEAALNIIAFIKQEGVI